VEMKMKRRKEKERKKSEREGEIFILQIPFFFDLTSQLFLQFDRVLLIMIGDRCGMGEGV
jgi:hypothetical protein